MAGRGEGPLRRTLTPFRSLAHRCIAFLAMAIEMAACSTLSLVSPEKPTVKQIGSGDMEGVGLDLSPLAKKIPQAKRGGVSAAEQKERERNRKCFINVVDWLCKNEKHAPHVWNKIITGDLGLEPELDKNVMFDKPPKAFGKIESSWVAQWIVDRSGGELTPAFMQVLDTADPAIVHDMLSRITMTTGSESLPEEFQEKALLNIALELRMQDLGSFNIKDWALECVNKDDKCIDWWKGGPFFYKWEGGKLAGVMHRRSGVEIIVPDHISIQKCFNLESPMSDACAAFVKQPFRQLVSSFFGKNEGPNEHKFDKKGVVMKKLLARAQQQLQEIWAKAAADTHERVTLTDHVKERRLSALAKAREAVGDRAQKRARTVTMEVQE